MFRLQIKYLSFFFGLISILSFFNIIYSHYLNWYLNLDTYYYSLFISLSISILFFKIKLPEKKLTIFDKILTVFFGYILIPFVLAIPFYFSIYNLTFYINRIYNIWKYKKCWSKPHIMEIFYSMDRWIVFFIFNNLFDRHIWWKF